MSTVKVRAVGQGVVGAAEIGLTISGAPVLRHWPTAGAPGGLYSSDALENLVVFDRHAAEHVLAERQDLRVSRWRACPS